MMKNECIVIIDAQKDFISLDGNYARRHAGIYQILQAKSCINKLLFDLDKSKFLIVTSSYTENQFAAGLSVCIPGTEGHKADINTDSSFTFITKSEHSAFSSAAFINWLQNNKINQLVLCGFLAEYCVMKTASDALAYGYPVRLLSNCIGTGDDVQHRKEHSLNKLKSLGAELMDSESYLELLSKKVC